MTLKVQRLSPTARLPQRGSAGAAGYDLAACLKDDRGAPRRRFTETGTIVLGPGARALIPTGIAVALPPGTYGRIGPRSGLALRHGLHTLAGIVDRDYTDEVGVLLVNLGQDAFAVEHGMRIAQLVIETIATPEVVEVDRLDTTERGPRGFGSTGI